MVKIYSKDLDTNLIVNKTTYALYNNNALIVSLEESPYETYAQISTNIDRPLRSDYVAVDHLQTLISLEDLIVNKVISKPLYYIKEDPVCELLL